MTRERETLGYLTEGKTLEFLGVINVDYTTERFSGDANYHVWAGTVGKVLLCAHVRGCETHVGEPFAGFHAGVLLSRIISAIDGNMNISGSTVPPTLLMFGDSREEYNVMTPQTASAYLNICMVGKHPVEMLESIKTIARQVVQEYERYVSDQYSLYCGALKIPEQRKGQDIRILFYSELLDIASRQLGVSEVELLTNSVLEKCSGLDERKKSFAIVETILAKIKPEQPTVVLFYAPPFYPYVRPDEKGLHDTVKKVCSEVSKENHISINTNQYYPYISDMSYLMLEPEIDAILKNIQREYPGWGKLYNIPFEKISRLQLPIVNIGPHGYGAHQCSERVEKFYSMQVLPVIIHRVVRNYF